MAGWDKGAAPCVRGEGVGSVVWWEGLGGLEGQAAGREQGAFRAAVLPGSVRRPACGYQLVGGSSSSSSACCCFSCLDLDNLSRARAAPLACAPLCCSELRLGLHHHRRRQGRGGEHHLRGCHLPGAHLCVRLCAVLPLLPGPGGCPPLLHVENSALRSCMRRVALLLRVGGTSGLHFIGPGARLP